MSETKEIEDLTIEELREKAKLLAKATGRDEEDILADLLDDGILNNSNKTDGKDLVEQLKEAAELISTVQNISKEVSENTVLNGGENATEVKVETTLEGDIVDRALESVQRKAEKIKVIIAIVAPILLLLTGGVGLDYFMSEDPSSISNTNCESIWRYDDTSLSDGTTIYMSFSFYDDAECGIELEGHFVTYIFREGESSNFDAQHHNVGYFVDGIDVNFEITDLEEGNYWVQTEFHDIECEDGTCEHGDEWRSPHTPYFNIMGEINILCDAYLLNEQAYVLESDSEKVQISADVAIVQEENNCDSEQFEIIWRLYQGEVIKYEHRTYEAGVVSDPDGADYVVHTWDYIEEGTYEPRITLRLNEETLDEKWITNSINREAESIYGCTDETATNYDSMATENDGSCEYPPEEPCEVGIHNHYRGHVFDDAEQDAILIAFQVVPKNCEGKNISIDIDLFQNGYTENYSHQIMVVGDADTDVSHIFDGVAVGNSWIPRITATVNGEQKELVNFWGIDVVKQYCEINLYDIAIGTNSTHASVAYDLDCGYEYNELEGYNVSVQFLAFEINSTNNTNPAIVLETTVHYVEGWASDTNYLTLTNFTSNNTTHYDFYWYATWTDENGDIQFIERKWLNRELQP